MLTNQAVILELAPNLARGRRSPEPIALSAYRNLPRCVPLDARGRTSLWQTLCDGTSLVVASWSMDARRVFVLAMNAGPGRPLSACERGVARLVGSGCGNKEIAFELGIARSSAVRRMASVIRRLGLATRLDLATLNAALDAAPHAPPSAAVCSAQIGVGRRRYVIVSVAFDAGARWSALTDAEQAIAALALAGHDTREMSRMRRTSAHTIANQLSSVFARLGVSGRAALAAALLGRSG
jgi:DNA-binding CsgD family transcriptional regulator